MRLADVDFLRSPTQPAGAWWLLTIGVVALAGSLAVAHRWHLQRQDVSLQEQALIGARQARMRPAAAPLPTLAQRRWMQAQPELGKPWKAVFRAVESATREPIYLLSMNMDPANGVIRLEGEALGFDEALTYVQELGAEPAFSSAMLESHADVSASSNGPGSSAIMATAFAPGAPLPPNATVVRFSASAHWRLP